ncbi:MAG: hypothetical protein U9Q78_07980, partial [Chloroflexota bacterium]|nr:hypothetical protein [Chloroflexota bacterium]
MEEKPTNRSRQATRKTLGRLIRLVLILALLLTTVQSSAIPPSQYFDYQLGMVIAGHQFNLAAWELQALADKGKQFLTHQPPPRPPAQQDPPVRAVVRR